MKNLPLRLLLFSLLWPQYTLWAQNVFNDVLLSAGSSDNSGRSTAQTGLEVLRSSVGVTFEAGAAFEHVGQLYVAQDGIWNPTGMSSTDYFGYAPNESGSYIPYLGVGIMGASANNGGLGAGRPTFGHIQLNSTGFFPVVAGMHITHSLAFNANGPGKSCIVTTPNLTSPASAENAVSFSPTAAISGADDSNYIDGYASVSDLTEPFTLPLGDPSDPASPLHPLTIISPIQGTITARYQYRVLHPTLALGKGINSVATTGSWPISAPTGTHVSVQMPAFAIEQAEATNLRLVGWDGQQWVDLSGQPTTGACSSGDCPLTGTLRAGITDLAIGSTTKALAESMGKPILTLWPNPTQNQLNLHLSASQDISAINVLDLQGRLVLRPRSVNSSISTTTLPAGNYLLEVQTTQGQSFRKSFVKQP